MKRTRASTFNAAEPAYLFPMISNDFFSIPAYFSNLSSTAQKSMQPRLYLINKQETQVGKGKTISYFRGLKPLQRCQLDDYISPFHTVSWRIIMISHHSLGAAGSSGLQTFHTRLPLVYNTVGPPGYFLTKKSLKESFKNPREYLISKLATSSKILSYITPYTEKTLHSRASRAKVKK